MMTAPTSDPRSRPSELERYFARLQQAQPTASLALKVPPAKIDFATPQASRGRLTMLNQGDLRIDVELGVLLQFHVFRGTGPASQVSEFA
jgi:hypothetical protein